MYNKEEAKIIREKFWNEFKSWSGRKRTRAGKKGKWVMNDTGMRQIRLKFHFDEKSAVVAIEVDTKNLEKRFQLWEKLESLKALLDQSADFKVQWEIEHQLIGDKTVSRVYDEMQEVNIYDPDCWQEVKKFFYSRMTTFEEFFIEYRDFLKYG